MQTQINVLREKSKYVEIDQKKKKKRKTERETRTSKTCWAYNVYVRHMEHWPKKIYIYAFDVVYAWHACELYIRNTVSFEYAIRAIA